MPPGFRRANLCMRTRRRQEPRTGKHLRQIPCLPSCEGNCAGPRALTKLGWRSFDRSHSPSRRWSSPRRFRPRVKPPQVKRARHRGASCATVWCRSGSSPQLHRCRRIRRRAPPPPPLPVLARLPPPRQAAAPAGPARACRRDERRSGLAHMPAFRRLRHRAIPDRHRPFLRPLSSPCAARMTACFSSAKRAHPKMRPLLSAEKLPRGVG